MQAQESLPEQPARVLAGAVNGILTALEKLHLRTLNPPTARGDQQFEPRQMPGGRGSGTAQIRGCTPQNLGRQGKPAPDGLDFTPTVAQNAESPAGLRTRRGTAPQSAILEERLGGVTPIGAGHRCLNSISPKRRPHNRPRSPIPPHSPLAPSRTPPLAGLPSPARGTRPEQREEWVDTVALGRAFPRPPAAGLPA